MPSLTFDEEIFVWALASRSVDARRFKTIFRSDWLEQVELIPILNEIYTFVTKHGISPSLSTLEKIFKDRDEEVYNLRIKPGLNKLLSLAPDQSEILFTLEKAKDIAAIRSFNALFEDERIIASISNIDGKKLLTEVHNWLLHFSEVNTETTMNIKEALDHLVSTSMDASLREKLPSGIDCLDRWSGGGLRAPQLGIIMAPTGQGKSAILMNMAYKMSKLDQTPVWFVSNELDMVEQAERLLSRISGFPMKQIQDDPTLAYAKTIKHWDSEFESNLRITDVGLGKNTTVDDLEAIMTRWTNISGWKPRVLILDYMGRMCPSERGYRRSEEWQWFGGIAGDLIKLGKKHNLAIWTACQTNRSGMNTKSGLDMAMAQSSVRHFQEASLVVGAQQIHVVGDLLDPNEKTLGMQFTPLKARHAGLGSESAIVQINLSTMLITNREVEKSAPVAKLAEPAAASSGMEAFMSKIHKKIDEMQED